MASDGSKTPDLPSDDALDGDAPPQENEQNEDNGGDDDLFGDEEDDDLPENPTAIRRLDDAELDSGDDEGRMDRVEAEEADEVEYEQQEHLTMDMEIPRQALPEPSDGETYVMKVPDFLSIDPQAWQIGAFQPPTTDHHSRTASATFSAYNTALSTVRWRPSPHDPSDLQSNARINRWSDGSLTLQLASDPSIQYEIDGNSLAPPQRNPIKPTPTSVKSGGKNGRLGTDLNEKYDQTKDANTYLIVPVESAECLRVTHKVTAGLVVRQTASAVDNALEKLQAALASATNAAKVGGATGALEVTTEDPEMGRKRAEELDRQLMREKKRRENAQERERQRQDRTLGRSGLSRQGGLNVGMLEDDELGDSRGRVLSKKARAKPRARRNSEYSTDEEMGRKRFTREDSYDQDDGFLAPSDEEEVVEDDEDEDEDDGIVEERREKTPKRALPSSNDALGDDADAEGEDDEEIQQTRTKRRRIVDEDDDE